MEYNILILTGLNYVILLSNIVVFMKIIKTLTHINIDLKYNYNYNYNDGNQKEKINND